MLLLQFQIDGDIYAFDVHSIVEVAPFVELKQIPYAPHKIAGVFNYRGKLIPVINLSIIIKNKSINEIMSTRIIIVSYNSEKYDNKIVGLLAENVTETITCGKADLQKQSIKIEKAPYFTDIMIRGQQMIQIIDINRLISNEIQEQFFLAENDK